MHPRSQIPRLTASQSRRQSSWHRRLNVKREKQEKVQLGKKRRGEFHHQILTSTSSPQRAGRSGTARPARAERASHHPAQESRGPAVCWNAFPLSPLIITSHYNGIRLVSKLGCLFPFPCLTPIPAKLFTLKGGRVHRITESQNGRGW